MHRCLHTETRWFVHGDCIKEICLYCGYAKQEHEIHEDYDRQVP